MTDDSRLRVFFISMIIDYLLGISSPTSTSSEYCGLSLKGTVQFPSVSNMPKQYIQYTKPQQADVSSLFKSTGKKEVIMQRVRCNLSVSSVTDNDQ
jgi:hypothetical protein